jgi:hypothetical protein
LRLLVVNPEGFPLQAGVADELILVARWGLTSKFSERVLSVEGRELVYILDLVEFHGTNRPFAVLFGIPAFVCALIAGSLGTQGAG